MEKRIFDVQQVGKILHLPPKKIERLAEHGELDGRKSQGKWLFSKADLLVWFEKNMDEGSGESHFETMEEFAEEHVPQEEAEELSIADLLPPEAILFPFTAKTKDSVIRELARKSAERMKVWDADRLADALRKREEMMSTAMENGVAILHPRRPMPDNTAETFLALGVSLRALPFGGGFNNLTDLFFLVCATDDQTHLRLLAGIGRMLSRSGFLDRLRQLESPAEIHDWIRENVT